MSYTILQFSQVNELLITKNYRISLAYCLMQVLEMRSSSHRSY